MIGIILFYPPDTQLKDQGLGRLLTFVIQGLIHQKIKPILIIPTWMKKDILELLEDAQISPTQVELLQPTFQPLFIHLIKFANLFSRKKKKPRGFSIVWLGKLLQNVFIRLLSSSLPVLIITSPLYFIFFAFIFALGIIAVPFIILYLLTLGIFSVLKSLFSFVVFSVKIFKIFKKLTSGIQKSQLIQALSNSKRSSLTQESIKIIGPILTKANEKPQKKPLTLGTLLSATKNLRILRRNTFAQTIWEKLREKELNRLISMINRSNQIQSVLIPTIFWPETKNIQKPSVVVVPDLVMLEFPALFRGEFWVPIYKNASQTVIGHSKFITYSEHVAKAHLCKPFRIPRQNITVIPHAPVLMDSYLRETNNPAKIQAILREYLDKKQSPAYYYSLLEGNYLFYSSQNRPHKNILNLIKAFAKVQREHYRPIKLVLTGRLEDYKPCEDLVKALHLQKEVIILPGVPSKILAALNAFATLAVNPTFFEGGFPFTFAEAYSVGTPSLMSSIPVVNEIVTEPSLREMMLFNPNQISSITERMIWGLDHREELFKAQHNLFAELSQRTWGNVASEYIATLKAVSGHE